MIPAKSALIDRHRCFFSMKILLQYIYIGIWSQNTLVADTTLHYYHRYHPSNHLDPAAHRRHIFIIATTILQ